jgi:hypothetical protein
MKKNFQKIVIFLYFYLQPNTSLTFKNIRLDSSIWAALKFVKPNPFAKKLIIKKHIFDLLGFVSSSAAFMLNWDSSFLGTVCWFTVVKRRASPEKVVALVELVFHLEEVLDELVVAFEKITLAGSDFVQRRK